MKCSMNAILGAALLAACTLPAVAQSAPQATAAADPCATQRNTIEINQCAQQTQKDADRRLNEAYQALVKSLVPRGADDDTDYAAVRKRLVEAQRAWITFRDSDCEAKLKFWESGTIRGAVYQGCLTERTEQRIKELKAWREG